MVEIDGCRAVSRVEARGWREASGRAVVRKTRVAPFDAAYIAPACSEVDVQPFTFRRGKRRERTTHLNSVDEHFDRCRAGELCPLCQPFARFSREPDNLSSFLQSL